MCSSVCLCTGKPVWTYTCCEALAKSGQGCKGLAECEVIRRMPDLEAIATCETCSESPEKESRGGGSLAREIRDPRETGEPGRIQDRSKDMCLHKTGQLSSQPGVNKDS